MIKTLLDRLVRREDRLYLAIALAVFLVTVGGLLLYSEFVPYVTDGNESFSMYAHARNMKRFGILSTAGLTDEANPLEARAHPYVYTHQGNFPRFVSYLLLLLGIESIEWHIGLISLVVGVASVYFCFQFFARSANRLVALLVCLVFWTDYLLFVQWQANTFRVWHPLFLFACLLWVQIGDQKDNRRMALLLGGTVFLMFYFEIVFAAFVLLLTIIYVMLIHRRQLSRATWCIAGSLAGCIAAMSTLLIQLFLFLGSERALNDIRLTFVSRNFGGELVGPERRLAMLDFFLRNNLVYWDNVFDDTSSSKIVVLGLNVWRNFLEVYTPFLLLIGIVLGLAIVLRARDKGGSLGRAMVGSGVVDRARGQAHFGIKWTLLAFGSYIIVSLVSQRVGMVGFPEKPLVALEPTTLLMSCLLSLLICKMATGRWFNFARIPGPRILVSLMYLAVVAVFMINQNYLYASRRMPLWLGHIQNAFGDVVLRVVLISTFLLAVSFLLGVVRRDETKDERKALQSLFAYLLAGTGAFVMLYMAFPGYLISGYLLRYAPLPVFLSDVSLALLLYVLICRMRAVWEGLKEAAVKRAGEIGWLGTAICAVAIGAVLLFIPVYWTWIQYTYFRTLSPRSILFMKRLTEPPLKEASFVSNNYTLPVSYFTGAWAFQDHEIQMDRVVRAKGGWAVEISGKYMWFADRDRNVAYLRPRYYLCRTNPDLDAAAKYVSLPPGGKVNQCSVQPLFRDVVPSRHLPFAHRLVDYDRGPLDSWSIIELDERVRLLPLDLWARRQAVIRSDLSRELGLPVDALRDRPNLFIVDAAPGSVDFSKVGSVHTDLGYGAGLTLHDGTEIWIRYAPIPLAAYFTVMLGVRIDAVPGEVNQYLIGAPRGSADLSRLGIVHTDLGYAVGLTLPDGTKIGFRYETASPGAR